MAAKPSNLTTTTKKFVDSVFIIPEQIREFMDDLIIDSDLDLAYHLQLQEALTASLDYQPSPSSSAATAAAVSASERDELSKFGALQPDELSKLEQLFKDRLQCQIEMRNSTGELNRRIHDQSFAREILHIPDDEWDMWGDCFEKPFGEGSSKRVENQGAFRLYFKGLVSEEMVGGERRVFGGIGIAICDSTNNLVFELKKPLTGDVMNKRVAEAKALIEGLLAAIDLGLKRVTFHCDYYPLYQFVLGRWPPKQSNLALLINQVARLRERFEFCHPKLETRHDIKFAFKLAREAIVSQIIRTEVPAKDKKLSENCVICLEDCDVNKMFSVDGCLHRYCFSCMKQHVEVKLLQGMVPKCPHVGCKINLSVDSCAKFLTPKNIATMHLRIKEASIPVSEKVYCPYPRCSALMTKSEVLEYTKDILGDANQSGIRKCMKCHGLFCINCKVPWHSRISCNDFKRSSYNPSEDVKLKSLASVNLWRQCVKCNHMIELAEGCYHMTCRCGYEFCYLCGAEWKNKKSGCSCPLWDEGHILYDEDFDRDFGEEEEVYESDEDEDDDYYVF